MPPRGDNDRKACSKENLIYLVPGPVLNGADRHDPMHILVLCPALLISNGELGRITRNQFSEGVTTTTHFLEQQMSTQLLRQLIQVSGSKSKNNCICHDY